MNMKKIWLGMALALAGCFVSQAQDFEIYVNGKQMADGDTLELTRATVEGTAIVRAYTIFKNVGEEPITFTGTKVASLPDSVHDGWCIWENCLEESSIEAEIAIEGGLMYEGSTEYLDIRPKGYTGDGIYVTYTFSTKENPDAKLTFTLHWILGKPTLAAVNMTVDGMEVSNQKKQYVKVERETSETATLEAELTMDNTGTESLIIQAEQIKLLGDGTSVTWCVLGSCNTEDEIEGEEPLEPGEAEPGQHLGYTPKGYVGTSLIYYSFYAKEDPFCRTDFVVCWVTTEQTGGNDTTANETADLLKTAVYPNPASTTARLSWEAVEGAVVLNIRSVSGQMVYSRSVEGMAEAEINVAGFTPGMYFYTLERQGERLGSGKLLVR